jgi:hypothetical protein
MESVDIINMIKGKQEFSQRVFIANHGSHLADLLEN